MFLTCATDFFYQKESEEGQECLTGNRDHRGPRSATKLVAKMSRSSRGGHDKDFATADRGKMKNDHSIGQRFWSYGWIG